jgi:predicted transcriptional regulator of viral defense system
MAMIEQIRRQIPQEEFDYQMLLYCLKDYERPRDKIRALLKSHVIIRVKKGLYVFGPDYSRGPFSRELLANLIYGPSYVSLDYALSYYGLIPERVETVTSVTCGKNRVFSTPVGRFTYWSVPLDSYRVGIDIIQLDERRSFFMATPEKALADKVCHNRGFHVQGTEEFESYLLEDLRIDPGELLRLDSRRLKEIAGRWRSRKIHLLTAFLHQHGRRGR